MSWLEPKIDCRWPHEPGGRLGEDCNRIMAESPYDWVLIVDSDVLMINRAWYEIVQQAIRDHPHTGIFTCWCNNIGNKHQQHPDAPPATCFLEHQKFAEYLWATHQYNVTSVPRSICGFFMVIQKAAWEKAGGFPGVGQFLEDNDFSKAVLRAGYPIHRLDGVYAYHIRDRKVGSWVPGVKTSYELAGEHRKSGRKASSGKPVRKHDQPRKRRNIMIR